MAKDKTKTKNDPQKRHPHLQARIAYLQKAAMYLTAQTSKQSVPDAPDRTAEAPHNRNTLVERPSGGLPHHLSTHLMQIARKSQLRLRPDVKHNICKLCGNILIGGETSTKSTENLSNGGKKPHADVLVIECGYCGAKKRFPVGATRQTKMSERRKDGNAKQRKEPGAVKDG
jgi:ribonuclease P protein subunit RPR2